MENKRKQKFEAIKESNPTYNEQEIILDVYDGAHMVNTAKKKISIISFSSKIINERSVRQIGLTAASGGILTWM